MRALVAPGLVAAAFAATLPGEKDWTGYTFEQYVKDFGKSYSAGENSDRRGNFEAILKKVIDHNKQEDKSWFATINRFSDMSQQEFKAFVKGTYPAPPQLD